MFAVDVNGLADDEQSIAESVVIGELTNDSDASLAVAASSGETFTVAEPIVVYPQAVPFGLPQDDPVAMGLGLNADSAEPESTSVLASEPLLAGEMLSEDSGEFPFSDSPWIVGDVDGNGVVQPIDLLIVINGLNSEIPVELTAGDPRDVNVDGLFSTADADAIIAIINAADILAADASAPIQDDIDAVIKFEDITAVEGVDYEAGGGTTTATFTPANILNESVVVRSIGDRILERNETFAAKLESIAVPADLQSVVKMISGDVANITIPNDDIIQLSIQRLGPAAGKESELGTVPFRVGFTEAGLATSITSDVDINFNLLVLGDVIAADYTISSLTGTIPVGGTYSTIDVTIVNDTALEPDEDLIVTLASYNSSERPLPMGNDSATVTIETDDVVTVSINSPTVVSGGAMLFVITLSAPLPTNVTFNYATSPDSAGDATTPRNHDFNAKSGAGTIIAGLTTATVSVSTVFDATPEPDDTFFLNLSGLDAGSLSEWVEFVGGGETLSGVGTIK